MLIYSCFCVMSHLNENQEYEPRILGKCEMPFDGIASEENNQVNIVHANFVPQYIVAACRRVVYKLIKITNYN